MSNEQNFTSLISAAVTAKMTPDFIENEVNTRVEKLIVECISNAMRTYSDTGKEIERAVKEALKVDRLDLPSYGSMVTKILKAQIETQCSELVAGRLAADMAELLNLAPKEIKLSKIAKEMIERHGRDGGYGQVITVIVKESDYGYVELYLDEDVVYKDHEKYQCRHHVHIDRDGKIFSATVDSRPLKDTQHIGRSYGLGQMIRAWVACGTKIEIDIEYVETSVGD